MSHIWRKSATLVASAAVAVGMLGISATGIVSAQAVHHGNKTVIFSDFQLATNFNPFQATTVFDVEVTALTQPSGELAIWGPKAKFEYLEGPTPKALNKKETVWSVTLHKGMKWSNGDPITAADYVLAWHIELDKNVSDCVQTCDDIKSMVINKHNDLNTTVTLFQPTPTVLYNQLAVGLLDSKWALNGIDGVNNSDLKSCVATKPTNGDNFSQAACNAIASAYEDPTSAVPYESNSAVTAGPYQISNFDPNSGDVTLVPNPNYTSSMPGGKPTISTMKFIPYGTAQGMIDAAATHSTDATMDYTLLNVGTKSTPDTLASDANAGDFKLEISANADPEFLFFNVYNKNTTVDTATAGSPIGTFANPFYGKNGTKVRQALLLAFNRADLIADTFNVDTSTGEGLVSYCSPINCTKSGSAPYGDIKGIKGDYDPLAHKGKGGYEPGACAVSKGNGGQGANNTSIKDALKLLHSAGYGPNHHLTVYLDSSTKAYRVNERAYLQSCWDALGSWVNVQTQAIPSGTLYDTYQGGGTYATGHYEAGIIGYGGVPPDPAGWSGNFLSQDCPQIGAHSGSQGSDGCIMDKIIDKGFNKGGKSLKSKNRAADYAAVQVEVSKEAYQATLAPLPQIFTFDNNAGGFAMNAWVAQDTWNAYSWT